MHRVLEKEDRLLFAHGFDVDLGCNFLANHRDGFGARAKHHSEVAALDRIARYFPMRPLQRSLAFQGSSELYVQRHRFCHAVHGKVAEDVAALRPGLLYAATLERNLRIFRDAKELGGTQMRVALGDTGVDAGNLNLGHDR